MRPHQYGDEAEGEFWTLERYREAAAGCEAELKDLRRRFATGEDLRHTLIGRLGYLGRFRRNLMEFDRALEALGEALDLGASVELCPECTHVALVEVGIATRESNDLATSEAVLQRLVDELEAQADADPELVAVARIELGTTIGLRGEGRQNDAATAIMPAIPLLVQIDAAESTLQSKRNLAACRAHLGNALSKSGQHALAIPHLRQACVAYHDLGDKRMELHNQVLLACALTRSGSREAFHHYEETIVAFHSLDDFNEEDHGAAHHNFAIAYMDLDEDDGRLERAARELRAALRIRRAIGAHDEVADTCQLLASLLESEEESQALLDEAKAIRARLADQVGLAEVLQVEGRNRRLLGLDSEARDSYLGAIGCVEAIRARLGTASGRATLIAAHRELYAECALLHLDLGFPREAFEFSEAARGRSLIDVQAAEMPGLEVEPAFREARHRLAGSMTDLTVRLRELGRESLDAGTVFPAEVAASLEAELAELEGRWDEVEAKMAAESPRFAARAGTGIESIWSARRVQDELLDERQALLEYLVEDDECVLFCLTADEFRVVRMEDRWSGIAAMAEGMVSALEQMTESYPYGRALYGELIEPVEDMLVGKRELLISADQELHRLPFAALLRRGPEAAHGTRGDWSDLPYLVKDFDIRYVASATSKGLLRDVEWAEGLEDDRDLLGLAATLEAADGDRPAALASLPHARAELDRVAAHFDSERVRRLPGADGAPVTKATAVALMTETGTSYRFIHLATHAIADDERPWQAAVVFEDGGMDGYLTARELLDLRLPTGNVTLSGCQTVGTQIVAGEGIVGLALALRHAGARCVCASWWPVFDRSTMELMDAFYASLAGAEKGTTVPAALRRAQRSLIAAGYHPRHWAAFGAFG